MRQEEKELIEAKFSGINAKIDSNFELLHLTLNQIKEQTILTNSRVNGLESQTQFVRFFEKRPILLGMVILGFFAYSFTFLYLEFFN